MVAQCSPNNGKGIMLNVKELKKFYNGKRVLLTGHTGFKGSYMCVLLKYLGAKVYGYSLKPEKGSLYELLTVGANACGASRRGELCETTVGAKHREPVAASYASGKNKLVESEIFADIRDEKKLTAFIKKVKPDYILHMAAQPLVLEGYKNPRYTYDVNVMGTVTLMEAIKNYAVKAFTNSNSGESTRRGELASPLLSILNVTTDKVYENNDLSDYAFKESDKLCGRDPYSNSKSCSELVTYTYNKSFFQDKNIYRISTARAGNVIGGGDLNKDRIIPDCYRSIKNKKQMIIRNPHSIRPYQFVLEPLILYLNIMAMQVKDKKYEGNYNIGPDKKNCLTTKVLTEKFFRAWGALVEANALAGTKRREPIARGELYAPAVVGAKHREPAPHEASFLRLDNKLIKKTFNYKEIFNIDTTMKYTTKVYHDMLCKKNIYESILEVITNTL